MIIKHIFYNDGFAKQFKKLPQQIQVLAEKKQLLFKQNPLHPSLRLHPLRGSLEGVWSISISMSYRIIFKRKESGDIIFISIGTYGIYKNL